jgi:hypothetical protein
VIVTGYVEDESELFALFERVGVFLFLFPEGLTARRSSVNACLQSDRPIVASAPQSPSEFDHHVGWTAMIAGGALLFVSRDATPPRFPTWSWLRLGRPAGGLLSTATPGGERPPKPFAPHCRDAASPGRPRRIVHSVVAPHCGDRNVMMNAMMFSRCSREM